jgi:hypothetical protein
MKEAEPTDDWKTFHTNSSTNPTTSNNWNDVDEFLSSTITSNPPIPTKMEGNTEDIDTFLSSLDVPNNKPN